MMSRNGDGASSPTPEQITAYVDGEPCGMPPNQVALWLANHPEAAAEVEDQRRLARLWESAAAPGPADAEWGGVLERIESALASHPVRGGGAWPRGWGLAVRAASVLLAVTLALGAMAVLVTVLSPEPPANDNLVPGSVEPLPVASADDVEINSINAADVGALVVGELPVKEALVLLSTGEVRLDNIEPDDDNWMPDVRMDKDTAPMIVAPSAALKEP